MRELQNEHHMKSFGLQVYLIDFFFLNCQRGVQENSMESEIPALLTYYQLETLEVHCLLDEIYTVNISVKHPEGLFCHHPVPVIPSNVQPPLTQVPSIPRNLPSFSRNNEQHHSYFVPSNETRNMMRHILNALRRGESLRAEDYMLFDLFINGVSEMHDRHLDMKLYVDNMSYEVFIKFTNVPKGVEVDCKTVITSDHAIKLETVPEWLVIVVSGYIGLEFIDVYRALGSEKIPSFILITSWSLSSRRSSSNGGNYRNDPVWMPHVNSGTHAQQGLAELPPWTLFPCSEVEYGALLALEESTGDVKTGLSEEVILKSMKQRKHLHDSCCFKKVCVFTNLQIPNEINNLATPTQPPPPPKIPGQNGNSFIKEQDCTAPTIINMEARRLGARQLCNHGHINTVDSVVVAFVETLDQLTPGFDPQIGKLAQRLELIDAKTKEPKETLEVEAALFTTGKGTIHKWA
ncbi:hypothetical protein L2E82_13760 [Cichorium intybus]|uniref:Uncharacterized protein n=1 Tax=Cichorium intybus TaxID=13427 RepID=A0ACB9EXI2_CICIN|nr:hypothetical protein L2E82_13760 [Cichorium intybus]